MSTFHPGVMEGGLKRTKRETLAEGCLGTQQSGLQWVMEQGFLPGACESTAGVYSVGTTDRLSSPINEEPFERPPSIL